MAFRNNFFETVSLSKSPGYIRPRFKLIISKEGFAGIWLPIVVITLVHYFTDPHYHWVHDLLRRAYYLPIVIAAIRIGMLGGLITSGIVTMAYIPHAFLHSTHYDPAPGLEKLLEILLYFVVASVAGYLSDLECKRRYQLQEAFDKQQLLTKQLVRSGRLAALGEVVAGIAHEIKNPLHSLMGTAEIVDPVVPLETEEHRMWEIHKKEIRRLDKVANQFLSFARPAPSKAAPVDLGEVAGRLVDLVGAEARQKNIDIKTSLPETAIQVIGDLDQLAQVGLNIAVNAIKAIGENGGNMHVSVGTQQRHGRDMAFLRIENDGPGIDPDELELLFDPFHSNDGGTGLGLSISARIAEQYDGYIEVDDGGLGVAFTLYLPHVNTVKK